MEKFKDKLTQLMQNKILKTFLFFIFLILILGYIYHFQVQNPSESSISRIEKLFTYNDYTIPYYVAKRYLIWIKMRSFYYALDYALTLFGIVASLITVFYASKTDNEDNENKGNKNYIVFFSLLSICFTIANIYINTRSLANMAQHAWRELDICIVETLYNTELSITEKDKNIIDKTTEMEKYLETFEH